MRTPQHLIRLVAVVCALVLAACSGGVVTQPVPSTSSTRPGRDFTVATTERVTTYDPAAVTDAMGVTMAGALYQRLMSADQGRATLYPDAARDCVFTEPTVYECTLKEKLAFHNWTDLDSSDVKFSIERALRLAVPGSSASQLSALDRVETPDALTVRFVLKWPDNQFGFALAGPAASIVDPTTFREDALLAEGEEPVGSGPFRFHTTNSKGLLLRQYSFYKGHTAASVAYLQLQYFADSTALEAAMRSNEVDVVWRGLNDAALKRLDGEIAASPDHLTESRFRHEVLGGTKVHLLVWSPSSGQRLDLGLRERISQALQDGRTLGSIIPGGVAGHTSAFPLGGAPSLAPPAEGARPSLTVAYVSTITGERERARDIRDRIEAAGYATVTLTPDSPTADLLLVDLKAWVATPFAWMQTYRDAAPPGSAAKVADLERQARTVTDATTRDQYLAEIQQQAAADLTVLPISQEDDHVFYAAHVKTREPRYGPGWQLALWPVGLQ